MTPASWRDVTAWVIPAALAIGSSGRCSTAPARRAPTALSPTRRGCCCRPTGPTTSCWRPTFGVVMSLDGGQTWTYSCEHDVQRRARDLLSNRTTAARSPVRASPTSRSSSSDDHACTWNKAQEACSPARRRSTISPTPPTPTASGRCSAPATSTGSYTIVESTDGGSHLHTVRFTAAVGDVITGVELARSDANTAYVTLRSGSNFAPKLAVTKNGGTTWDTRDLSTQRRSATSTSGWSRSIRPTRARSSCGSRSLGRGAGRRRRAVARRRHDVRDAAADLPAGRRADSFTRLIGRNVAGGGVDLVSNVVFRSTNGGMTFTELDAPHGDTGSASATGARTPPSNDDQHRSTSYALGQSTDDGTTFQPLMQLRPDAGDLGVRQDELRQDDCDVKADLGTWSEDVCTATPMPQPPWTAARRARAERAARAATPGRRGRRRAGRRGQLRLPL